MLRFRPFRNSDPPALADIWRSQSSHPRVAQPMSAAVLEHYVLAKPFFDRLGLIVACDGARPMGFVHAGFGPDEQGQALDLKQGVVCQLVVEPCVDRMAIAMELLAAAEDYLRKRGATTSTVGAADPHGPFYLGFYGGAGLPGELASDTAGVEFFREADYEASEHCTLHRRLLIGFRPPVDRAQALLRRTLTVQPHLDPTAKSWWEACAMSVMERMAFTLHSKTSPAALGTASVWEIMPLSLHWGMRTFGIDRLDLTPEAWNDGSAVTFLSEILKASLACGATMMETIVVGDRPEYRAALKALEFDESDRGLLLRKQL